MKVTFFGTTTLLFDDGKDQILFDAHITRPSLKKYVLRKKVGTNTALCDNLIKLHKIDRLRAIFISHTHHDHVMDAPYIANKCGAKIYGSDSAKNVALGGNVPPDNIVVFEHGSNFTIGEYKIRILKSLHSKPNIFNNDLGQQITEPLVQPASLRAYKEGGSYDFYIEHREKKLLIRPSCNYIEGSLKDVRADTLLLGISGLGKEDEQFHDAFYRETVGYVQPKRVIPVHWDNFFAPLKAPLPYQMRIVDAIAGDMAYLKERLGQDGIAFDVVDAFETVTL